MFFRVTYRRCLHFEVRLLAVVRKNVNEERKKKKKKLLCVDVTAIFGWQEAL
jgi:hypothetical protein